MQKNDLIIRVNGIEDSRVNVTINNNSYQVVLEIKESFFLKSAVLEIPYAFSDEKVMLNGFQTWSTSKLVSVQSKEKKVAWIFNQLQGKYGDYQLTDYKYLHSWSYTYLKNNNYCRVIGSLNEENAFHIIEFDLKKNVIRIILDVDELLIENATFELFNIYDVTGVDESIVDSYFKHLNYESRLPKKKYYGWTSWYQYYTKINESVIIKNLKAFDEKKIPLDYFQIDDGYQSAIGDWLHINSSFPNGMKIIADEIHSAGFKSGLWLSPFICEKKSKIYKNHQAWLIKDKSGRPLKIGYNPGWSGYYYGLNILLPEVKEYLKYVFHTVINEWGYDLLKLDFLFAIGHIYSQKKTRGQIMREAMVFLKDISKGAHIIGCGVPLASVYGLFEFSRVSSDVGLKWEDPVMKWFHFKERVSTINAIETSITRRHMNHAVFLNDPDVFILRAADQKMTWEQRKTLFLVNLIFGALIFTSDSIDAYNEKQMAFYLFTFKIKESTIKHIKFEDLIYVEISTNHDEYLFIININPKDYFINFKIKWLNDYTFPEKKVNKYDSFYIKK